MSRFIEPELKSIPVDSIDVIQSSGEVELPIIPEEDNSGEVELPIIPF